MLGLVCTLQDAPNEFTTSEGAVAWLQKTLVVPKERQRMSRETIDQRTEAIRSWLDRVDSLELDLGDQAYIMMFAEYAAAGSGRGDASDIRAKACRDLLAYGVKHDGFTEGQTWANWLGRLCTFGMKPALEGQDWPQAQCAARTLITYAPDPFTSAKQLATLLAAQSGDVSSVRTSTALAVADNDRISFQEKGLLFTQLYGGKDAKSAGNFVAFSGPSLTGGELSVADFKGKVLLIDFWATWCGPCMREMPHVVAAWKQYKDQGFAVLGVSLDRANAKQKIMDVMQKTGMEWPQIYDGQGWKAGPARLNGVRSIPATFLLDRNGKLVATNLRGAALGKKIAEVLAEQPEPPAPAG